MHDSTPVGGAVAVKAVLLASRDLRPNERLVLVAIAAHTNRDGDAWPSVSTIAEYAGVSVRTVQRALARLVQLGRIAVRRVAGIATRVYRLVLGGDSKSPGGDSQGPGGDNGTPGGDSQVVTRSVKEGLEEEKPRSARDWRRFLPKNKTPRPSYPERRGAALPVPRNEQCPWHRGSPRHNCGPCRSERLAGGDL